jgi:hypothetical protein
MTASIKTFSDPDYQILIFLCYYKIQNIANYNFTFCFVWV